MKPLFALCLLVLGGCASAPTYTRAPRAPVVERQVIYDSFGRTVGGIARRADGSATVYDTFGRTTAEITAPRR